MGSTNYDIGTSAGNGTVTGSGLGVQEGGGMVELTASVPGGYGTPVPGMAVWLDGIDRDTLSLGDDSAVTAWADKSGNGHDFATPLGTVGDLTYGATINGHGAVSFPNGKGLLNTTYTHNGPDTTFFVLLRHANAAWGAAEGPVSSSSGGSDSASPTAWAVSALAGTAVTWRSGAALFDGGNALPAADGDTPFIWSAAFDAAGDQYFAGVVSGTQTNEAVGTPSFNGDFAINQLLVGGRLSAPGTGGNWCHGDIGEVLLYNTFLNDTDRDAVKTYLAAKWLDSNAPPYAAIAGATVTVTVGAPAAFTISGAVELQSFAGTNRLVRFVMSEVSGGSTNHLQTNDVMLTFSGATAGYTLPAVPTNTTHLSAKTAWHLRKRQAVSFGGGTATVNFTAGEGGSLKGGDLVTVNGGPVADTDNSVNSTDYLLLLGKYLQTVGGDADTGRADIDGDGAVTSSDYLNLLGNYLTSGDPQ
jgi:hypothetical protein